MTTQPTLTRRTALKATGGAALGLTLSSATAVAQRSALLWSTTGAGTVRALDFADGSVYAAHDSGVVRALGAKNGAETARIDLARPVRRNALGLSANEVLVVTENDRLHALDRSTLSSQWQRPISSEYHGITVVEGVAILAHEEEVVGIRPSDGKVLWRDGEGTENRPMTAGNRILLTGYYGNYDYDESVRLVNPTTGELSWRAEVYYDETNFDERDYYNTEATAHAAGPRIICGLPRGGDRGYYAVLNRDSGALLWETESHYDGTGALGGTDEYAIGIRGEGITSFDPVSGESNWEFGITASYRGLDHDGDTVYVTGLIDDQPTVMALNAETGVLEWEYASGSSPYWNVVAGRDRVFMIDGEKQSVVAFAKAGENNDLSTKQSTAGDSSVAQSDGEASFSLTTPRSRVPVGSEATITLSAVNYLTSKSLNVQLLLELPSGVHVTGVRNAEEGSNQFTTTFSVPSSGEDSINVNLSVNESGEHSVLGRAIYYFGDEQQAEKVFTQAVTVYGVQSDGETESQVTETSVPGFSAAAGVISVLGFGICERLWRVRSNRD